MAADITLLFGEFTYILGDYVILKSCLGHAIISSSRDEINKKQLHKTEIIIKNKRPCKKTKLNYNKDVVNEELKTLIISLKVLQI